MRGKLFAMAVLLAQAPLAVAAAPAADGGPPYRISLQGGFAPVVKRCLPAVVNVSSSKIVRTQASASPFLSDPFFQQFFGDQFLRQFQVPSEERELSLGSGVIVTPDGYTLTNNHVIAGATHVKVALADQREFEARVVGKDAETDIAVLKVDAQNLPAIPFGDSARMQPGDFVLAIGNPFGLSQTVTMGIVSAVGRGNLGIEDYEDFIQTDAAINPGNSGGALINGNGQLIGINTAILSGDSGGNQGVGFAIPIDMARQVMDQIVKERPCNPGLAGRHHATRNAPDFPSLRLIRPALWRAGGRCHREQPRGSGGPGNRRYHSGDQRPPGTGQHQPQPVGRHDGPWNRRPLPGAAQRSRAGDPRQPG